MACDYPQPLRDVSYFMDIEQVNANRVHGRRTDSADGAKKSEEGASLFGGPMALHYSSHKGPASPLLSFIPTSGFLSHALGDPVETPA